MAALIGCGGSAMPRAQAPRAAGQCYGVGQGQPLIVEWPAAEKSDLQARMATGAIAVEYVACKMHVVKDCPLRGAYDWQRTATSQDVVEIDNKDELFAKLPLGAFSLQGKLEESGSLSVRTTVSGQYRLKGVTAADVPDHGGCSRATHLLTAMSVGAFTMTAGSRVSGGAGASVQSVALEGSTESGEKVFRQSGSADACSATTDEGPHMECSAPIQAFLQPLPRHEVLAGKPGEVKVTVVSAEPQLAWEVRKEGDFVCKTPCTRWVDPTGPYVLESRPAVGMPVTLDFPELRGYEPGVPLELEAKPSNSGLMAGGIVTTALGGAGVFFGGFLAGIGALAERDGLVKGGGIAALVGAAAVVPGIWMIVKSGPGVEVTYAGRPVELLDESGAYR